jgi:hypothetical protein
MSTLSQFAPFAGGGLKSFQTGYGGGTVSYSSGEDAAFFDITISSVNTAKAIPGGVAAAGPNSGPPQNANLFKFFGDNAYADVMMRLTSSTNLRLSTTSVVIAGVVARWQVAEAN